MPRVRLLSRSFHIFFRAQVISPCSSNSACLQVYCWKLLHLSLWTYHINFSFIICAQSSLRTSWACSNTLTILLVFARSRVFKLAGKTHYSNVSFRVGSIGSVLVYRHWFLPVVRYWLLPVNSPTAGHIWKHVFPKGSNDRYTVGEFFSVPVFTNIIQDTMRKLKKKHSKRKLQILNADFSPQF